MAGALRKAGLDEEFPPSQTATMLGIEGTKRTFSQEGDSVELQSNQAKPSETGTSPQYTNEAEDQTTVAMSSEPAAPGRPQSRRKKSVTFADDTKDAAPTVAHATPSNEVSLDEIRATRPVKRTYSANDVFDAIPESIEKDESPPVIPINESPEDSALRRQMLQYSMDEVGAVVAEIDLDESGSQTSYSSDEDGDEQYTSSADEEEDAFGRTTRRVLNDDYLQEMQELEKRLNAKVMHNVGPNMPENLDSLEQPSSDKMLSAKSHQLSTQISGKKGVRFADELDISPAPNEEPTDTSPSGPAAPPVHEAVVERTAPSSEATPAPTNGKKVSRFKSSRTAAVAPTNDSNPSLSPAPTNIAANRPLTVDIQERKSLTGSPPHQRPPAFESQPKPFSRPVTFTADSRTRQVPEGPTGKTLAETLIERPTIGSDVDVPVPDEFDPALMHQEVAVEYHRMRNRMMQRDGGFAAKAEEEERVPLTEEEGGRRKVSRFKAARLARLG